MHLASDARIAETSSRSARIRSVIASGSEQLAAPHSIPKFNFSLGFEIGGTLFDVNGKELRHDPQGRDLLFSGAEPMRSVEIWGIHDVLEVAVSESLITDLADELSVRDTSSIPHRFEPHDQIYWAVAVQLRNAIRGRMHMSDLKRDQLIYHLSRHIILSMYGGKLPERGDGGLDSRRMARLADYIESNLHAEMSITELASVAALSPFHFLRSFKRTTSMTPHKFVTARRMERALIELRSGDSLQNVASRYGFTELRHFKKLLLRHYGVLPA